MVKHIGPLSNVKAIFDPGCGKYPSRVRLAMEDGTIRTFWGEAPQPKPKRWNPLHEIIGYPRQNKYHPKHAKKRPVALQRQPVSEGIIPGTS